MCTNDVSELARNDETTCRTLFHGGTTSKAMYSNRVPSLLAQNLYYVVPPYHSKVGVLIFQVLYFLSARLLILTGKKQRVAGSETQVAVPWEPTGDG